MQDWQGTNLKEIKAEFKPEGTTKIQSNKIGGGSYEEKGCKLRAH